jgi:hypothetical protein
MGAKFLCGFRISFQQLTLRQRELLDQFLNVLLCTHLDHLRLYEAHEDTLPDGDGVIN